MWKIHQEDIWLPPVFKTQKMLEIPALLLQISTRHIAQALRILPSGLYSPSIPGSRICQAMPVAAYRHTSGLQTHSRAQNLHNTPPGSFLRLRLMRFSASVCFQNNLPMLNWNHPVHPSPDTASAIHLRDWKITCTSLNICHSLPVSFTNSSFSPPLSLSFTLFYSFFLL